MIKLIVAALWISVATTGAMLFAFYSAQEPDDMAQQSLLTPFNGLDYVKIGIVSVPVFDQGQVHGYFLARLVAVAEGKRLSQLKLPAQALFSDQVYSHLYANPQIDFTNRDALDIDAFRQSIRDGVNAQLGEDLIHQVLVEQIDYLPRGETGVASLRPSEATVSH